jgi:PAS domain S-box-containing protein
MVTNGYINIAVNLAIVLILLGFTFFATLSLYKSIKSAKERGDTGPKHRIQKTIFVLFYLVALGGWGLGYYAGKNKDAEIRSNLQNSASRLAEGLNPQNIPTFTFTPEDLKNPAFRRLNEQLRNTAKSFDGDEIFTISQKNNRYVYGPSVLGSDTVITQIPGTIFSGPSAVLDQLFQGGEYVTYGPYFNGNQSVLTGFAAVLLPRSTKPVMLMGVNMPKQVWLDEIRKAELYPMAITLGLLILLWIGFVVFTSGSRVEFSGTIWWKSPAAIFTFLCGLIITTLISVYTISVEKKFRSTIFNQISAAQASQIRSYINNLEYQMNFAAQSLQSTTVLDEVNFKEIVAPLYNNSYIIKTGLAVMDPNFGRGFATVPVVEFSEPTFEFPILKGSQFPYITNETRELLQNSIKSGLNNFDGPLVMPLSLKRTICFYYPVKLMGPKPQQALFFIMAEPDLLLSEAIAVQGPGKAFFEIKQIDEHPHSNKQTVAYFPINRGKWHGNAKLESTYPHLIFGKVFNFHFKEGELFLKLYPSLASTLSPLIGLILSMLLSFFVGLVSTRKARLEKEVQMRTQQLEQSQSNYRMISDNIVDVIWIYNLKSDRITFTSPSVKKVFGYSVEEALNMGLSDILTPKSFEFIANLIPENVRQYHEGVRPDSVTVNTLEQIRKDGSIIVTEVVTSLIPDEGGHIIEILGVTRDITEKVKASRALEESEEKYRLLIENQQDLIIKIDPNGLILYASPTYCKTFGKTESQLIGQTFTPQIDDKDVSQSQNALAEFLKMPQKEQFHQKIKTIDGWKWLAWITNTIFDSNGDVQGFIGVGRDITQQKEYELQLLQSREMLQSQNEEYAMLNEQYIAVNEELKCTNEDLVLAIEKATESEKLKTAFLQNMSHEIRTPLNAVIGFSEMFSLNDLSIEDKHDYSEIIINSSKQLLSIVNDILTISTLETRQEKIKLNPVSIGTLMKELEMAFQTNAKSKNIDLITKNWSDGIDLVMNTDEMKLKQILNNLIGNAIKFTSKGYVRFGCEKNQSHITFFVEDTGIGIPPESMDHVFERFRQANNNDTSLHGGTGLGLAISKGHVELMGGNIWVESEIGKGSTFYFNLPLN